VNAYMVFEVGFGPEEGACLVSATNRKQALTLGRPVVLDWFPDARWVDVRVRRLQGDYTHHKEHDTAAHAVESPLSCYDCCKWGPDPLEPSGLCTPCANGENEW
jgi:hypothetical protein